MNMSVIDFRKVRFGSQAAIAVTPPDFCSPIRER
jgi:hypothetical protein